MMIKAAIGSDYWLLPQHSELSQFIRAYGGRVTPVGDGFTFKTYNQPLITIKDQVYHKKTALKTRSYDTASELMHDLKVGIAVNSGNVLDVSGGLILPIGRVSQDSLGYTANHIPQLYGIYQTGSDPMICTAVYGNYDMQRQIFKGQLDFKPLSKLWETTA